MNDKNFISYALKELIVGIAIIAVIVFVGINIYSFFKSGGKEPPKGARTIKMPLAKEMEQDGTPVYDADIVLDIPFSKTGDNFVFAEVVTDTVYQDAIKKERWVRLRNGYHYPNFNLPVDDSFRQLSLDRSFILPIKEIGAAGKAKYWLRFGMVEFLTRTKTYRDGSAEAAGRSVDELDGILFLPFRDKTNVTVYPRGEWTKFAPFYVEVK